MVEPDRMGEGSLLGGAPWPAGAQVIDLAGEALVLLPGRALFRSSSSELLVSDIHLGKAAAFRAAGRPLPTGTTRAELARLDALIATTHARRLCVLGDLVHHELDVAGSTLAALAAWLEQRRVLQPRLVLGNHDRHARERLGALALTLEVAPFTVDGLEYRHAPPDPSGASEVPWLAGHLHPGVLLQSRSDRLRVPVFWQRGARGVVLPAFGAFTGSHDVEAVAGDRLFAAGAREVLELPVTPSVISDRSLRPPP